MRNHLKNALYACGTAGMPRSVSIADRRWSLVRTFKHDFFAATGLYQAAQHQGDAPERMVLKIGRIQSFLGFPLAWLGRFLKRREVRLLQYLESLEQVPRLVGEYGRNGFAYRYIEGRSLDEKPDVPDCFFDDLEQLLQAIHRLDVCYLDFNKRGNILVGTDKRPHLIDFQISVRLGGRWCRPLRTMLQREDCYHLLKHKRRLRPDLMTEAERQHAQRRSAAIRIHRFVTVPLRTARRRLLRRLHRKGLLERDDSFDPTPENDPSRFESQP